MLITPARSNRSYSNDRLKPELFLNLKSALLQILTLMVFSSSLAAQVFINELHYDNTGGDVGEALEVAGPAGTDLSLWTVVLYNGSNGLMYDTINLSGSIPNQAGGYGTLSFTATGMQNGSPDGLALVNNGSVVQFLSYEGGMTANDGPASGMNSDDIGEIEASDSPVGFSLQLGGTGTVYGDFTWEPSAADTFGAINTNQNFGTPVETAPSVSSTTPADTDVGVALDINIDVEFSEDVNVAGTWFQISCVDSGAHTGVGSGSGASYSINPDSDFTESELCTVTINAADVSDVDADDPPDNMEGDYIFSFTTVSTADETPLLINEVDSDQSGTDAAEFVELFDGGAGNTPLDGFVVVLFNGGGDVAYEAYDLDGHTTNADGYFVLCGDAANVANCDLDVAPDTNMIQNGADAVALYQGDASDFSDGTPVTTNLLVDAIVYDTNDGDDAGLLILLNPGQEQVNEAGEGDSSAHSNQRCPNGIGGARNTDTYAQTEPTPGAVNNCVVPLINEVEADTPGTDVAEFIELFTPGAGDFPLDGYSIVLFNGSSDTSYGAFDLDGLSTDANGYFVLCGDAANVANCDLDVSPDSNLIQNGADAVALVFGNAVDYPNGTAVSAAGLVDALVYDTNDSDDAGLLVLMNAGQPQINEDGGIDSSTDSNQRCPNGFGGARNSDTYVQAPPTPGGTNGCGPLEIFTIQGGGANSIYDGFDVLTADNIVTAVGPEGFVIQTPDARDDGSVDTSNGIYVFTGAAPTVAVGDNVDVLGRVDEFFDLTEFSNSPMVTINSSGNPLPAAVLFGPSVPSPDPTTPSCSIEYECYEGMLVQISGGTVTGGNQSFASDLIAEAYITANGNRSFREPGVEYPLDLGGGIQQWDGNPEVFELDPDRLGLPNTTILAGSTFNATGVIGYDFGDYELWPTFLSLAQPSLPRAVRNKMPGETTVGSLNVYRFATDGDYATRLAKLSLYIRTALNAPDVLAVQEAQDLSALQDLADQIFSDAGITYSAYLVEGNDVGLIDVGFLVRSEIDVDSITQLGAAEIFTYDDSLLHDRPPLLLQGRYTGNGMDFPLAVMVVHNRSLNGIETERVQLKRLTQAQSIATIVQDFQTSNPDIPLIVVGDFNAYEFSDGFAHAVGHIQGDFNPAEELQTAPDLVNPNLTNQVNLLPANERYSFVFEGNAQALDHTLTSEAANPWVRGFEYGRGNADAADDLIVDGGTALRSSDHDGMVLFLMTDADGDGVADDVDDCPVDPSLSVANASAECTTNIPALDSTGLVILLLMLGILGGAYLSPRQNFRP